jgi:hypothetical protein
MNELAGDITAKVAVSLITEAFKATLATLEEAEDWVKRQNKKRDIFGLAARKYAAKVESLYNSMRIFGMSNPVELRSIYTRVNVLSKLTASHRVTVEALERHFNRDRSGFGRIQSSTDGTAIVNEIQKLVVLGKPGAGKTTFLKHITLQALDGVFKKKRIPIFLSLKDWSDSGLTLLAFVVQQFEICDFQDGQDFVEHMLSKGKCLLLLDGFDEVTSDVNAAITQIGTFVNKYNENQYILSCRIAAYSYCFPYFTDIEVADFTARQIESFINNWFGAGSVKARSCWQQLKSDKAIMELASIPLLLTLLCLAFDETMAFPSNKAELYKEAIDALLKKWDASRSINRGEIYQNLSPKRKESMLSRIAAKTFESEQYFIHQDRLESYISSFIQNLPNSKEDTLSLDSEAVLKAVEAQHGIFVERAKRIYSFSHLTFQEYFTARYFVDAQKGSLSRIVRQYLTNDNWREVFLLMTSMLDEADEFLMTMQHQLTKLGTEKHICSLLSAIRQSAARRNDLCLLLPNRGVSTAYDRGRLLGLSLKIADQYLIHHEKLGTLPLTLKSASVRNHTNELSLSVGIADELCVRLTPEAMKDDPDNSLLRAHTKLFPQSHASTAYGQSRDVIKGLDRLRTDYKVIDAALTLAFLPDLSTLVKYLVAHNLLLACLQAESYVSKVTRKKIMSGLLSVALTRDNQNAS